MKIFLVETDSNIVHYVFCSRWSSLFNSNVKSTIYLEEGAA